MISNQAEEAVQSNRSPKQWMVLVLAFVLIIIFTMVKDLTLSGNQPNILFYLTVPLVSMLGSALTGYVIVWLLKIPISFWDILFIVMLTDFLGQVYENITKTVYYQLWEYPGWLYIVGFLPLVFIVPAFMLVRWHKVRWPLALVIGLAFFIGGMALSLGFTALTGIETPGS